MVQYDMVRSRALITAICARFKMTFVAVKCKNGREIYTRRLVIRLVWCGCAKYLYRELPVRCLVSRGDEVAKNRKHPR